MIPGSLRQDIVGTARRALLSGALVPVPTDSAFIDEGGVRFPVRVLAGLRRKDEARRKQQEDARTGKESNPFLPPEQELTVGDISDTHIAVLNKFNVVEHHLLVVTRRFEDQEMLLTPADFGALWLCMAEYDALGFYNGGREAGASQAHKHLQLVPLPLAPEGPDVPIEPLLPVSPQGEIATVNAFPFLHAFVRLAPGIVRSPADAAKQTFGIYRDMLKRTGLRPPDPALPVRQSMPYCLIVTRAWMLLVPRSREFFEDISLNTLAFAGSFFVRNREQLERLKTAGVMNALASVAVSRIYSF